MEKVIREMGDPRASQMTRKFMLEYRSEKLQAGLMPSSINRDLCVLSAMFTVLVKDGISQPEPRRAVYVS